KNGADMLIQKALFDNLTFIR
ncbi:hypothetical protein, partial [Campylobacter jejuni]